MVRAPYDFPESSDGPTGVRLTSSTGTYNTTGAPTAVSDAVNFFKLTATGAETLYFYTDWDGTKHFRLININVKASASVTLTVSWQWYVNGTWGEKSAYAMSLTGTQALTGVTTAYPFLEDVPPGTKSRIAVTTGGACDVSVNAMGRYY